MATNVDALARDWLEAKRAETSANKTRVSIERELVDALGAKDEGSKTVHLTHHKVVLNQPVRRKLDLQVWEAVKHECPDDLQPVKVVTTADATGCKWLTENRPNTWRKIAAAFETTPGKISVKVEET